MQISQKIILGIDPGTIVMGYGVIAVEGNDIKLIEMGVLKLGAKDDAYTRLQKIYSRIIALVSQHNPKEFAIEAPFFGKNVQSMLKLGRAQGVAIAAAMHTNVPISEYAPRKVKQSVTGNGNAGKEQVMKMLQQILKTEMLHESFDAADALAVALCHHYESSSVTGKISSGKIKGWGDYFKNNPDRVK